MITKRGNISGAAAGALIIGWIIVQFVWWGALVYLTYKGVTALTGCHPGVVTVDHGDRHSTTLGCTR